MLKKCDGQAKTKMNSTNITLQSFLSKNQQGDTKTWEIISNKCISKKPFICQLITSFRRSKNIKEVIAINKIEKKKVGKKANTESKTKQMLSMSDKKFVYSYEARIQLCKAKKSNLSSCHNIFGCKNNLTLHGRIQEYWLNL